jgi:serine/threonine protein kinase
MLPSTDCPGPASLRNYLRGAIAESEATDLEQHLASCAGCLAALDELATDEPLLEPPTVEQTPPVPADALARWKELGDGPATPVQLARDTPAQAPAAVTITLPDHMGRYRILRQLDEGGMGTVYLAEDPDLGRQVALKVPHFSGSSELQQLARKRFVREARAAAQVDHAHVCKVYDVGQQDDQPFVVMAYVDGGSLARRLREQGRFEDCRTAVRLVIQAAEGLQAVHAHGIIHRDLKPANILLNRAGQPLLTDFGLAHMEDGAEALTATDHVMGTPAYMAPEQADPALGSIGPASDVYSLGVVLYHMLTGRTPFEGTKRQLLCQVARDEPPPPAQFRPDLDPALEAILLRALTRQPGQRIGSAAELAAALGGWLDGQAGPRSSLPMTLDSEPRPRRSLRRFWPAAAAAMLLLGALTWWRWPTSPPPAQQSLPPLKGSIDLRAWEPGNPRRRDRRLNQPGALPLKPGDLAVIEATLNRRAYLYVLLIETNGTVTPLYPWKPGNWNTRPADEQPIDRLRLPEDASGGWKVSAGLPGMETLVLLARETSLPRDVDLRALLGPLPPQKEQNLLAAVWFENGEVVRDDTERAFAAFDVQRIDDPVLHAQSLVKDRLLPHFAYSRAVSYAHQGK